MLAAVLAISVCALLLLLRGQPWYVVRRLARSGSTSDGRLFRLLRYNSLEDVAQEIGMPSKEVTYETRGFYISEGTVVFSSLVTYEADGPWSSGTHHHAFIFDDHGKLLLHSVDRINDWYRFSLTQLGDGFVDMNKDGTWERLFVFTRPRGPDDFTFDNMQKVLQVWQYDNGSFSCIFQLSWRARHSSSKGIGWSTERLPALVVESEEGYPKLQLRTREWGPDSITDSETPVAEFCWDEDLGQISGPVGGGDEPWTIEVPGLSKTQE